MSDAELRDLLEYIGQEQACYTSLLDLSRKQHSVIESGDVDSLLALLGRKQKVLARVCDIEESLRPYKRRWSQIRSDLGDDDSQVLDMALSTVEELLAELIAIEKESEQLLVARRDDCERQLQQTVEAKTVDKTYEGSGSSVSASTLDVRSE